MNPRRYIGIIDDDDSLRRSLGRLLQLAGFQTVLFQSAEEFLVDPLRRHLRCLLVDIRLGGMSGIELHGALCARGVGWPTIIMSAHANRDSSRRFLEQGVADFLEKPFTPTRLVEVLERAFAAIGATGRSAGPEGK